MVWDLLSLIAGGTAFWTAFSEGKKAGTIGALISLLVGLGVGIGCFCAMRVAGKWVLRRHRLYEPRLPPFRLMLTWLLCFAAFAWVIVSGFLGFWITKLVVHLSL